MGLQAGHHYGSALNWAAFNESGPFRVLPIFVCDFITYTRGSCNAHRFAQKDVLIGAVINSVSG